MQVKDLMTTEVMTCAPDDELSNILSTMVQKGIHQVPIIQAKSDKMHKKGEVQGLVTINKAVTREIFPKQTKVSVASISTPKLNPSDSVEKAAEMIVKANMRAIPVVDRKIVGILSEQDMMSAIKLDGTASDVAKACIYCTENDNIGKVKDLIVHNNISRIPVVKDGKIMGVVGTLDLVKVLQPGKDPYEAHGKGSATGGSRNRGYTEQQNMDKTLAINFVHNAPVVKPDSSLNDVIELLQNNDEVIVEDTVQKIITHKDILTKYVSSPKSVALIQLIGAEDESAMTIARIQQTASEMVKSLSKSIELQPMKLHIKKHKKQGPKNKYSIHIELPTSLGNFIISRTHGKQDKSYSDLITLVQKACKDLERQIRDKLDEFRKVDRSYRSDRRAQKEGY